MYFSNVKKVYFGECLIITIEKCQKVHSVNLGVSPAEKATSR